MCQDHSKTRCCENPEQLKGKVEDCTKEQIEKCHGKVDCHPCMDQDKKNQK
ncbi:hypothetical protein JW824_10115 [bacterium]|nr:hypothetical protein [bacterium]